MQPPRITLTDTLHFARHVLCIACIESEIYVIQHSCNTIEVYNASSLQPIRTTTVPKLINPTDLVASRPIACLFLIDCLHPTSKLVRVGCQSGTREAWSIGDEALSLSLTPSNTLLVTCDVADKLREFSTDGVLLRQTILHRDLLNPTHAVRLPNGEDRFVVCHGKIRNRFHRVCLVDAADRRHPTAIYGDAEGLASEGLLSVPSHVGILHIPSGTVLAERPQSCFYYIVVDHNNQRIAMLDSSLKHVRDILLLPDGIPDETQRDPIRVCVTENQKIIVSFIACSGDAALWTCGQVAVFDVCIE